MDFKFFIILLAIYLVSGGIAYAAGFMCGARNMGEYYAKEGLERVREEFNKRLKEDKNFRRGLIEEEDNNATKKL